MKGLSSFFSEVVGFGSPPVEPLLIGEPGDDGPAFGQPSFPLDGSAKVEQAIGGEGAGGTVGCVLDGGGDVGESDLMSFKSGFNAAPPVGAPPEGALGEAVAVGVALFPLHSGRFDG